MRSFTLMLAPFLLLVGGSGCAKYEYSLVKPEELSRHVGTKVDAVVTIDPLEYRMLTVDNRLVLRIFNPNQQPVELLGARSATVDPKGQSHPLRSQTIVPGSFIKLIIPPIQPKVYDPYYGPNWGMGVGAGVRASSHSHCHSAANSSGPVYLMMMDESDTYYWDWSGEGECRLLLVYNRAGKEFTHEFLFRRQKM
jgi:hypothetical protein